jgi:hypothetical protein
LEKQVKKEEAGWRLMEAEKARHRRRAAARASARRRR